MKNTALFDVAKKLLQDKSSKMEQRERLSEEPVHAQLIALIKKCYENSKDKKALNEMVFLFFGIEFHQLELAIEMELYSQQLDAEKKEYTKTMAMNIEEYYDQLKQRFPLTEDEVFNLKLPIHENMALPMEYYERYPIGKTTVVTKRPPRADLIETIMEIREEEKKPCEVIMRNAGQCYDDFIRAGWTDKLLVDNGYARLADLPKVLKTNGDNELIEERLTELRVQISRYKQMPKEQRGTLLIEAQDKFNRIKTWLN